MKSYVVYTVKVKGINELIFRRYSDFFSLREKLTERWPGVFIPNIPPKKTVVKFTSLKIYIQGNLDAKVIDSRVKLLNKFCLKLSKFQVMFSSEEMKVFFSPNILDMKKVLDSLPNQSYEDLYLKYKRAFPDFYEVLI